MSLAVDKKADKTPLLAELYSSPYSYDFFQAVRLLRAAQAHGQTPAGGMPVRFKTLLSLETPASSIYSLQPAQDGRTPEMVVTFLGLTGPSGALPVRYTEMLLERRFRHRDQTAHHFFDLFNHRLITLFYQAWQKHHVFVDYERGGRDGFQQHLLSLVGLGTPALRHRLADDGVDDEVFAYYAGRLGESTRSEEGLRAMLADQFEVPVEIEQFHGRWLLLDEADCSQLGRANCTLGEHPMLGKQAWDSQTKFRIRVGPLKRQRFNDFLPTGKAYRAMTRLVKFCVGHGLEFDIQLVLDKRETPPCLLGDPAPNAARLGWSCWLNRSHAAKNDTDDVVLPEHARRLAG
jgi:type VI secretion system protein ImpH